MHDDFGNSFDNGAYSTAQANKPMTFTFYLYAPENQPIVQTPVQKYYLEDEVLHLHMTNGDIFAYPVDKLNGWRIVQHR